MEMVSNDQLLALKAGLPLDSKLVLPPPPSAREEGEAGNCVSVDEPAPTVTYPVAHRQSS